MRTNTTESPASNWRITADIAKPDNPLLDCLVLLTKLEGKPFSGETLKSGLPLEDGRLTPQLFVRAAARAGLSARVVKRPLERISGLLLPAVILLKNQDACVLTAVDPENQTCSVVYPASGSGEEVLATEELAKNYLGYTIFVRPRHTPSEKAHILKRGSGHWFWGTLWQSKAIYRDVLIASFLINLFALATPFFIINVYDRVVPNHAVETLWVLASGVVIIFIFELIIKILRGYFIDVAGKKSDVLVSAALLERVMGIKMNARPESVGAFAKNVQEFETIRDFITSATVTTLVDLPFSLLFLVVVWMLAGNIAFIPVAGIVAIWIYAYSVKNKLENSVSKTVSAATEKNAMLIESLGGIEAIKTLGAEGQIQSRWEQAVGYIAKWSNLSRMISSSVAHVATFFQHLVVVGVIISGVYSITAGNLTLGGLIAVMILSRRAMAPMTKVAGLATRYHRAKEALNTLNQLMQLPVERPQEHSFLHREEFRGGIKLQNVSFTYRDERGKVLDNISFQIKPEEHVALIGPTGSGKTTIGKLMLGLYEPDEGGVRFDGTDLRQIDPANLRHHIGYVPQDVMLFSGSVRDNIVFGAPYVDDKKILEAARLAGVMDFVDSSPLGFDMPVGERGTGLSGGQRQSLAIARALLLYPRILVLDEPSNAMDRTTERKLRSNLRKIIGNKTMVLITHRRSLLNLVDRIIVLNRGRIVADGPKAEILKSLRAGEINGFRRRRRPARRSRRRRSSKTTVEEKS